ncbi:MAG: hypothetical protein BECKG1743F_GA0114225_105845 [Candidatus Kentron sp. G]|nr:MAG: hypothetical protein BECKG1743E_GA0114224_103118 [Candidatus Kentron sp. G]VFN01483.1 MAG: hypothetical protein BECKG1743F_GA0114225_105845 [Candidatus Kentron sp. G]
MSRIACVPWRRQRQGPHPDIFTAKTRKISQDFLLRHPSRQIFEDVIHSYARAFDTGFPTTDIGRNGDMVFKIHKYVPIKVLRLALFRG